MGPEFWVTKVSFRPYTYKNKFIFERERVKQINILVIRRLKIQFRLKLNT